jgi:hypothetical protein
MLFGPTPFAVRSAAAIGLVVESCVEITAGISAVGGRQVGDGVGRLFWWPEPMVRKSGAIIGAKDCGKEFAIWKTLCRSKSHRRW